MTMENQNFSMHQGEDKEITVPTVDANGNSVDISGATLEWIMQRYINDATNRVTKSPTVVNANDSNDGVQWTLEPADTKDLPARLYWHECRITITGNQSLLFTGWITLKESGTKPD